MPACTRERPIDVGERENERREEKKKKNVCEKRSQRCRQSGTFSWQAIHSRRNVYMPQSRFVSRTVLIITAHADHLQFENIFYIFRCKSRQTSLRFCREIDNKHISCIQSAVSVHVCINCGFQRAQIKDFENIDRDRYRNSTKERFLFRLIWPLRSGNLDQCSSASD